MNPTLLYSLIFFGIIGLLAITYLLVRRLRDIPQKHKIEFAQTILSGIIGGLVFNLLFSLKQALTVDDIPGLIRDFLLLIFAMLVGAVYYGHFAQLKSQRRKKA